MDDITKLNDEVSLGNKARNAYTSYIKDFIERFSTEIFADFVVSSDDAQTLLLKYKHDALMNLETTILRDIETGKLAEKQLEIIRNNDVQNSK